MKKLFYFSLIIVILGCEEKPSPTTYSFTNRFNETLYGFKTCTGVDEQTGYLFNEVNHGKLNSFESTERVETDENEVYAIFSFDISTNPNLMVFYVASDNFILKKHTHNEFIISQITDIYGGTTYYILNSSNESIYNVESGYWNGSFYEDIRTHATLLPDTRSFHVLTAKPEIDVVFEINGKEGSFLATYSIITNEINILELTQQDIDYVRTHLNAEKRNSRILKKSFTYTN